MLHAYKIRSFLNWVSTSVISGSSSDSMSANTNDVNPPFGDGVIKLGTRNFKKDAFATFDYESLAFEVLDPVPPYRPEELLKFVDDVLGSPELKSGLQKAVQDLGDSAYSIEICFNNVTDGLRKAVAKGTQAQRKKLQGYANNWAAHHKEYIRLLWESRRIAGHVRVIANDFAGDFLGLMDATDITLGEKKAEISAYRKQLDEDAKKSLDLSQGFENLRRAVENFGKDVAEFLDTNRGLEAALEEAVRKVAEIKQEISRLDKTFFWSVIVSLGAAGVTAGTIALSLLCTPLCIFPIGIGAVCAWKGVNAYREYQKKQEKLAELEKQKMELEEKRRCLEGLHKIHAIVDPLKSDIGLIRDKLAVFGQIWQLIHADLNAVEKGLELATNSAGAAMFKRRLQTTHKTYVLLAEALYQYETNAHIQRTLGKHGE
ncbi:hypothetical protein EDC04DRAFT_2735626 [Pisolithus marmoratus]|nr:hypothetical protein EDC04DRAFT_2735626 [Pisolithus marmoratus]